MDFAYTWSGNAPKHARYQVNATFADAGIVALAPGAGNGGLVLPTTTSAADAVGVTLDASGTYVTAQQTSNAETERLVSVIRNPDAVYRALMSGGAAEGTALALRAVTTASTDGLAVTTAESWTATEFDEGSVWGYSGANAGVLRKITSTSATAGTVTVAFPYDTAVDDNFIRVPYTPNQTITVQFTTLFTQANASIAVGTGAACRVTDIEYYDISGEGRTKSKVLFMLNDHIFRDAT